MLKDYRTLDQIKKETATRKKKYYRESDYIRAVALTQAIEELNKKDADFILISARPEVIVNRTIPNGTPARTKSRVFTVGMYAKFLYKGDIYYIEINENPFFNSYIYMIKHPTTQEEKHSYLTEANDYLYEDLPTYTVPKENDWEAYTKESEKFIKQYKRNILKIIGSAEEITQVNTAPVPQAELGRMDTKQRIYSH